MEKNEPLKLSSISFKYGINTDVLLDDINLTIKEGSITAIVGLSGVGKTTLIQILNGTIQHSTHKGISGDIMLYGMTFNELKKTEICKRVGTVFQDPDTQIIFSNVEDELAFGMENFCVEREEMLQRINKVLDLLGIEDLRDRNPNKLSGGEKQLVVLGAILCLNPDIIILDECMAQVDKKGKERILNVLKTLRIEGKTIIMIEHDYANLSVSDEIYELNSGKLFLKKNFKVVI